MFGSPQIVPRDSEIAHFGKLRGRELRHDRNETALLVLSASVTNQRRDRINLPQSICRKWQAQRAVVHCRSTIKWISADWRRRRSRVHLVLL